MLSATVADARSQTMVVSIVGQSNEAGAGLQPDADIAPALQHDPVAPWGGRRSMWPTVEQMAARRGVSMWFWNGAVGATSLVHSWVGTLHTWQAGMTVIKGDHVLLAGRVYRNVTPTSVGILRVSTASPTEWRGPDGIVWQDFGPARAGEQDGAVFRSGDRLFDPNGYMANALAGLHRHDGEPWIFISIGQGDAGSYWNVTRAQYAQALIAVTDAGLAAGAHVAIGFTCASAKPAVEEAYRSRLIPGWHDALNHFAGNHRVVAGANLREALGPLTVVADGRSGLQPDMLHMNDTAYTAASRAWVDALARAKVLPAQ